ncbi:hypothetical protein EE612_031081 [Oryza sativa]|nr:hypothetical protein EE612_031081 [Oryza sativa]
MPEPLGRKSFPTTLSSTEDLPELWPPTTAMAGSESQRVGRALSSPWSPRAVQARCSLLTSEIRFSMAAAAQRDLGEIARVGGGARSRSVERRGGDEGWRCRLPSRVGVESCAASGCVWWCAATVW